MADHDLKAYFKDFVMNINNIQITNNSCQPWTLKYKVACEPAYEYQKSENHKLQWKMSDPFPRYVEGLDNVLSFVASPSVFDFNEL